MSTSVKPKVAVYKFSSCDGCQLSILNMEDELLDLTEAVDISFFLEATSTVKPGPYDIGIVEGSISTPHEAERIRQIREEVRFLIALGTCATAGGIQALRNFVNAADLAEKVYPHPEYLHFLETSTPLSEHVSVDLEIWGCPVSKATVLEALSALIQGRRPVFPPNPVCLECKRNGTVCVMVAQGIPCMGPVVQGGCGAICPANGRGCYGCFGPSGTTNHNALVKLIHSMERYPDEALLLIRNFCGYSPAFRKAADEAIRLGLEKESE